MTYLSRMFLAPRKAEAGTPPVNPWYDPNSEGLCVWGAWQAKGAVDYATRLTDLSGNGHNLTEGNGAVPWAAGTGWSFTAASLQYFLTGFTPQNDQTQTMLIQFTNNSAANTCLAGARSSAGNQFYIFGDLTASVYYANGGAVNIAPVATDGNLAVVGNRGYRNGIAEGGAMAAWSGASTQQVYLGAYNFIGAPASYCTAEIMAAVIYDCTLTAAQVAMIAGQMAAL